MERILLSITTRKLSESPQIKEVSRFDVRSATALNSRAHGDRIPVMTDGAFIVRCAIRVFFGDEMSWTPIRYTPVSNSVFLLIPSRLFPSTSYICCIPLL